MSFYFHCNEIQLKSVMSKKNKRTEDNVLKFLKRWITFLNLMLVTPVRINVKYEIIKANITKKCLIYSFFFLIYNVYTELKDFLGYLPAVDPRDVPSAMYVFACILANISTVIIIIIGFLNRKHFLKILRNFVQIEKALKILGTRILYSNKLIKIQSIVIFLATVQRALITWLYYRSFTIFLFDYVHISYLATLFSFFNMVYLLRKYLKGINSNIILLRRITGKHTH